MGWVWRDDEDDNNSTAGDINPRSDGERCSTRKVMKTQCKTEEVEPGKFIRKCEKTEQLLRDCAGRFASLSISLKSCGKLGVVLSRVSMNCLIKAL